jgi:hypothetical protein
MRAHYVMLDWKSPWPKKSNFFSLNSR